MEVDEDEKAAGEILRSLLSAPKTDNSQNLQNQEWQDLDSNCQTTEHVVWQIESSKPATKEFLSNNENIIQHIPVTYLSTESRNLSLGNGGETAKPVTYFLSRNVVAETPKYCTIGENQLNDSQKIVLLHEVDTSGSAVLEETKVLALQEPTIQQQPDASVLESKNNLEDKKSEKVGCSVSKNRKLEEGELSKPKKEKKISGVKKPLNKRKATKLKSKLKTGGKALVKKPKKSLKADKEEERIEQEKGKSNLFELTKLEDNVEQVVERFNIGCECSDTNCFDGLNPDNVFKHRLNIADLTKAEHDMYLMGVIMASVQNLEETCRHKERIRIRSSYAYQGKRVCLTAFLYLQHVTLYQMKRLRSHLKNHGVSPRIHGNRGRKPANTFSLDIYRRATNFIQNYVEKNCVKTVPNFTTFSSNKIGSNSISGKAKPGKKISKIKILNKMTSYHLPPECTKKTVHKEYKSFCESLKPSQKVMKYSTFTNFLKKQFPNVKFQKMDRKQDDKSNELECKKSKEEESSDKSMQTVIYIPSKSVQGEQTLLMSADSSHSQIILNGQEIKFCTRTQLPIPGQMLVGNQIYSTQCANAQQIFTVDNIA